MKIVGLESLLAEENKISALQDFLEDVGHEFTYYNDRVDNEEEIISRAKDADVIIIANLPITKKIIDGCRNLKMISVAFTGVDHIDLDACKSRNIAVSNAAGYSTKAVAELTIGLIIDVYRKITEMDKLMKDKKDKGGFLGRQLSGKTVGIIGTGSIGLKVAEYLKAFGCKVLAYSKTQKEEAKAFNIKYVTMDELLKESDIVSIHLPLNEKTHHLIGARELTLMKQDAILINTARGPIVDYVALAKSIEKGELSGAATDVYESEPPILDEHPLFNTPSIVTVPHIGYATKEAIESRADIVFENILLWEQGAPQNVIL